MPDVAGIRRAQVIVVGLIMVFGSGFNTAARGQVAFVPGIGAIPTGATLTVTPAVSADRRYVRLGVNPFFNALNGFTTINVSGAVGGGGGFAGMNGAMGQVGFGGAGGGMTAGSSFGLGGESLAGPLPFGDGLADLGPPPLMGDRLNPSAAPGHSAAAGADAAADQPGRLAEPAFRRAGEGRSVQAAQKQAARQRRTAPPQSSRRPRSTTQRRIR